MLIEILCAIYLLATIVKRTFEYWHLLVIAAYDKFPRPSQSLNSIICLKLNGFVIHFFK